jgi:hypothetical protein
MRSSERCSGGTGGVAVSINGKPSRAQVTRWRQMDINNPPFKCGVYAIKSGKKWMYIGRSVCIGTRIKTPYHPVRIMKDFKSLSLSYWWHPVGESILNRTEHFLIKHLLPEWNGGTQFDSTHYPPYPSCKVLLPLTDIELKEVELLRNKARDAFKAITTPFFGDTK